MGAVYSCQMCSLQLLDVVQGKLRDRRSGEGLYLVVSGAGRPSGMQAELWARKLIAGDRAEFPAAGCTLRGPDRQRTWDGALPGSPRCQQVSGNSGRAMARKWSLGDRIELTTSGCTLGEPNWQTRDWRGGLILLFLLLTGLDKCRQSCGQKNGTHRTGHSPFLQCIPQGGPSRQAIIGEGSCSTFLFSQASIKLKSRALTIRLFF